MKQKKLNNKGFSLVELIVVIAIMAVLIGLLAPQFIKYIDRSKYSTDIKNGQEIATVIQTLIADGKITADSGGEKFSGNGLAFKAAETNNLIKDAPTSKTITGADSGFYVSYKKDGTEVKVYVGKDSTAGNQVYPTLGADMAKGAGRPTSSAITTH